MVLRPSRLRRVARYALHMGPDERRLHLLVEFAGGGSAAMGPFDREALTGLLRTARTLDRSGDRATLLVDPDSDTVRIAFDGYRDDHHAEDEADPSDGVL